ncbi:hypothetical protein AGABI1DRAFT_81703 [Agaricus bisporus var. burnettii JB137-S8]|uniref:Uncharacterized protein n=1 Tax=Agaricus bisporus var. burnettii (strain JB137-S8 / ATCC MYA-4627 / FGSC 10392) TaxID=597362 RepID=K5Y6Y9_AGABU|nr:uncharacterized protein AGABI1DRAFT_81703 [Agaricus bisporus var. burnettii JB137-S8]EKM83975.1 hypothetical protein AGABI1DRAFT_81703 [Agaricus bisporus var. burnettii JB137-S8]
MASQLGGASKSSAGDLAGACRSSSVASHDETSLALVQSASSIPINTASIVSNMAQEIKHT